MQPPPNPDIFSTENLRNALPPERTETPRSTPSFRGRSPTRYNRSITLYRPRVSRRSRSRDADYITPIDFAPSSSVNFNRIVKPVPRRPQSSIDLSNPSWGSSPGYIRHLRTLSDTLGEPLPTPPLVINRTPLENITDGMGSIGINDYEPHEGVMIPYTKPIYDIKKNNYFDFGKLGIFKLCDICKYPYNELPEKKTDYII
uniref:Uncharacterized protein n=1 Tax=viral metagenome TaxID=1070528 RepID=A0A6C0FER2_9ZZZZ|tara:strand:+ start:32945 stop:33547 length:603 start_codon:yes stop_codon:yes gene_type:complete